MAKAGNQKKRDADIPVDESQVQGTTPFITGDTARQAFEESRVWLRRYYDPLDEFERIARNKPSPKISPELPRITDGTMASIVQEQPKRILQQLATGKVSSPDYPEYAPVADVVLNERLVPLYNRNGNALQKQWNMLGKAMTYGLATSYTFFTSSYGHLHTDYVIPYVKDVITEKGKVFAPDCNIAFMRSWYQKRDIQAIINREKQLMASDKNYKSGWDLKLLANFMEEGASSKPADVMTPAEKEKGGDTGGFEVIHAFQAGQGAEFYSFSPRFQDGKNLRTKINRDPRGKMPLDFLYCNIDLSNPLGRGQVELSGGIQNLLDQQLQMFQFMTTLEMGPPLMTWGNVNKASLRFRPNAIWDMGSNANNKVEPYAVNNHAIQNFANNMQTLQAKIYALNNSNDTSIGSQSGNTGQSKTSAGVKNQVEKLGVSDNYLRKQAEGWINDQSETSLNVFFAEMEGEDEIALGAQQLRELSSTRAAKFIKTDKQGNSVLQINYSDIEKCIFDFATDPDSSKSIDDQDQLQKLQTTIQEVGTNRIAQWWLSQDGKKLSVGELYNQLIKRMGLENIDSILVDLNEEDAAKAKQAPYPLFDMPKLSAKLSEMPPAAIQAFLGSAGINIDPQSAAQPSAQFQWEMARDQALANRSKIEQISIDSADLTDAERAQVLAALGIQADQSGATSPKQQKINVEANNSVVKAGLAQDHHDYTVQKDAVNTAMSADQQAHQQEMDLINAHQAANSAQNSHDLAVQGQQQAAQQQSQPDQSQSQPQQPQQGQNGPQGPDDGLQQDISEVSDALSSPLKPAEEQVVTELFHRGFDENDTEQAIVMLRQGVPLAHIIQTLGAKKVGNGA